MKTKFFKIKVAMLLTIGLLFSSASAKADDGYLVLSTMSLHFENFEERNSFTPGVGWEYSPSNKVGWHAGTLSDSFGYQSYYGGLVYASKARVYGRLRFLLGASIVHKQFKKNAEPETKLLPFPALEIKLSKRSVVNITGSPAVDFADHKNNAVMFFQYKLQLL